MAVIGIAPASRPGVEPRFREILFGDYAEAAEKRGRGFYIQGAAAALLWAAALIGIIKAMLHGL